MSLASHALHHSVSWREVWAQYADTRLLIPKLFFAGFGRFTHLDVRTVILFGALVFIATFATLLVCVRTYLRRPLTVVPVLALGVVWFSVADVQNSLWSFQLAWYLVLFFFVAMCGFLLGRRRYPVAFLAFGIGAAVLASLTEIQGFAVWAAGLVCLVWESPWGRRTAYEVATWLSAAAITAAFYFRDFDTGSGRLTCVIEGGHAGRCSTTYGLTHPVELARFVTALVGNVVPTLPGEWTWAHQLLGAALCAAAVYVVVQAVRERRERNALPVLLIAFAFQFDLMVALGRLGLGTAAAGTNRYTMPNLVLVCGIVVYATAHMGVTRPERTRPPSHRNPAAVAFTVGVAALVVVQAVVGTWFGVTYGRAQKAHTVDVARVVVNLEQIPVRERDCYLAAAIFSGPPPTVGASESVARRQGRRIIERWMRVTRALLIRDELSLFHGDGAHRYRAEGPPPVPPTAWWRPSAPATCETERPLTHDG